MPNTAKVLYRGSAPTSSTTLYTVPSSTKTIITDIKIINNGTTENNVIINIDGSPIIPTTYIDINSMISIELKQVLDQSKTITAVASSSSVIIHISGVEVS